MGRSGNIVWSVIILHVVPSRVG